MIKQLVDKYNNEDTLALISLYPKKGETYSAGTSGVASFAKNTVTRMDTDVVVLADYSGEPTSYEEGNTFVVRCFAKNSIRMWGQILSRLSTFTRVRKVLIQFDFALYGDSKTTAFIIPFLAALKLMGYQVHIVVHSVVDNIESLSGHVGLTDDMVGHLKAQMYNLLFHNFYRLLGLLCDKIVVNEEILKGVLTKFVPMEKIIAIPHGVDQTHAPVSKTVARKRLHLSQHEFIVMFFGFVNWFKGADLFAKTYGNVDKMVGKKVRFIIAGGKSATLKEKPYYQDYYKNVEGLVKKAKRMKITGYVPQKQMGLYFAAADLVVFPYRSFMSASGVLSLVFSYTKPFIISKHLEGMFHGRDFISAMRQVGLAENDVAFVPTKRSCLHLTEKVLENGLKKKMIAMAEILRSVRSYDKTAKMYEDMLFAPEVLVQNEPALGYTYSK